MTRLRPPTRTVPEFAPQFAVGTAPAFAPYDTSTHDNWHQLLDSEAVVRDWAPPPPHPSTEHPRAEQMWDATAYVRARDAGQQGQQPWRAFRWPTLSTSLAQRMDAQSQMTASVYPCQ